MNDLVIIQGNNFMYVLPVDAYQTIAEEPPVLVHCWRRILELEDGRADSKLRLLFFPTQEDY